MSDVWFSVNRQAPTAGEHTAEVLHELGYSEETISGLNEIHAVDLVLSYSSISIFQ
jgi:crotonobetainyl-CoA:carnitine CoA-transferase CaiB-like acyl-CoA transferase